MKNLNIAIVGFGKVGNAIFNLLNNNKHKNLNVVAICDKSQPQNMPSGVRFTTSHSSIIADSSIDVVIESVGGVTAAYDLVNKAINHGKHVVTTNKTLMCAYGESLYKVAKDKNVHLRFSGSIIGGSPIVQTLTCGINGLTAKRIYGVLNSGSNYVLTRMYETGETLEQAKAAATEFGYLDTASGSDLNGKDSLQKIILLKAATFGTWKDASKIKYQGINSISQEDIRLSLKLGLRIKLLAVATKTDIHVAPYLVSENSILGQVNGNLNGLVVDTEEAGSIFMAGQGDGAANAAAGALNDLMAISQNARKINLLDVTPKSEWVVPENQYFLVKMGLKNLEEFQGGANMQVMAEAVDSESEQAAILLKGNFCRTSLAQTTKIEGSLIYRVIS